MFESRREGAKPLKVWARIVSKAKSLSLRRGNQNAKSLHGPENYTPGLQGTALILPRGVLAIPSKDCLTTHTTSRTQWRTGGTARPLWLELAGTW